MDALSNVSRRQRPVLIGQEPGLLLGDPGQTGVLLIEDWGYEGLCARRSFRMLAELLADAGYPVLRADLPGMGGSTRAPEALVGIADLDLATDAALATLKEEGGCRRIVLAGMGLGSLLAVRRAVRNRSDVAALVLMAPMISGRLALREAQIRSAMIAERTRVPVEAGQAGSVTVAGLSMGPGLVADIRGSSFGEAAIPDGFPVLILPRPGRSGEEEFAAALLAGNPNAASHGFSGYDDLITDPTLAEPPLADFAVVRDWLLRHHAPEPLPAAPAPSRAPSASLAQVSASGRIGGEGYEEEVLVLGRRGNLVGTLCLPTLPGSGAETAKDPAVLFLTAGGTPRAGWALSMRESARALAREGITSLRLDLADIGDSSAVPGAQVPEHYHPRQLEDLADALDLLAARGHARVIATGACSGAYLALRGAIADPRIEAAVCVNLQRFLWDPREKIGNLLRFDHDNTVAYARKLFDRERLLRLIKGEVPVAALLGFLVSRAWTKLERATAPYALGLTLSSRLRRQVQSELAGLARRGLRLDLIYSEGDPGLAFLAPALGPDGRDAARYPGLSVTFLDGTDHNLTPIRARQTVLAHLRKAAGRRPAQTTAD
ncbi:alpha/beta fold hydrolase [Microvirga tunisiensis]|uniref:Alpha/beta fold hydrolase n=1 Tax=Pannonibacter tanglangensis TaxID=2750084 RepID=A0A7X5F434_9HYPH|nr:alpha/beta fold hydrolase [Pannonibacter sp. XCT-53]NBN79403.1 alpha/beta fold hydrolase [Pannonibacter sp. XCT-53]